MIDDAIYGQNKSCKTTIKQEFKQFPHLWTRMQPKMIAINPAEAEEGCYLLWPGMPKQDQSVVSVNKMWSTMLPRL